MREWGIPYREESVEFFDILASEPWAVFLDSGWPRDRSGRWDILAARPHMTLTTRAGITRVESEAGQWDSRDDPLELLRIGLGPRQDSGAWPFAGGAIGYFSYDLGHRMAGLPLTDKVSDGLPEMAVGLYDWAVLVDHQERRAALVGRDTLPEATWHDLVARFSQPRSVAVTTWQCLAAPVSLLDRSAYDQAFARVQAYITDGDCYQINLTQQYRARVRGDAWALYQALRRINPAPFSAYLNLPEGQILSSSPERFVSLRSGTVSSRPIKGTRPRSPDPDMDRQAREALAASAKDRAENLMIVDLLRNDLGKVCRIGSVRVPALFTVESFARVHHLVSTIEGELRQGLDALDLLRAVFPGGSITGAPKRRAMALIDALEPVARGVYCGTIGYLGCNGDMDTNIAIRTLVKRGDQVGFGVGGGIVADSLASQEYQECLDKAAPLLDLLRVDGLG
ncbi:MAG: aminodeoxychorismate synthase component I [Pseudomonadota bacterium]